MVTTSTRERLLKAFPGVKRILRIMPRPGYLLVRFLVDDSSYGGDGNLPMTQAFTPEGLYIGDGRTAKVLTQKYGIAPEFRMRKSTVCSIGYSTRRRKWFGWSHRAIAGFKTRRAAARFAESVS